MTDNWSAIESRQRLRVELHGAVQGVGFRPFVYRLAVGMGLAGWVINDSRGVEIEIEGTTPDLLRFLDRLDAEKPPIAFIHNQQTQWLEPTGQTEFEIRRSQEQGGKTVLILPDLATCPECLSEVFAEDDRRYRYPFTNCTNCGPRFSIIRALPYDRPHTSMRGFVMCPQCQAEYENPSDRRFHAQPNACPVCGPNLSSFQSSGGSDQYSGSRGQSAGTRLAPCTSHPAALLEAAAVLRAGQIVAVKGLGGFHLMCDAGNAEAIARLRARKPRPHKPLAIMARDLAQARTLVEIPDPAAALLQSVQSPIVLLPRLADAPVAANVAPDNAYLGVMLPYTPLHHLLLAELDFPVVATSGNLSDEPICTDEVEAAERLGHIADLYLVHNRPIERHVDDSIAWVIDGAPRLLRRARGYAPLPISLPRPVPAILAVGAHLKNTVALSIDDQVFISQHIGDLETAEAMQAFERVIADFLRLYESQPVAVAHDMHPDYLSTKWAHDTEVRGPKSEVSAYLRSPISDLRPLVPVQHHHAHLASVLAENQIESRALGVIWDGTGYGPDGTIWGGEFLLGDASSYERVAHLRPFRLPGGDAAVHEPRRVALSLLWELLGAEALERDDLAPLRAFSPAERRLLGQMLEKGVNAPLTTSMGRLFDGVAALLGLHQTVSFEGQAAMALEFAADPEISDAYPVNLETDDQRLENSSRKQSLIIDHQSLISAILADLDRLTPIPTVAARFHNTLVESIVAVAEHVGEPRVALSGGVWQNRRLTEHAVKRLRNSGFEVILHRQVPPNDGGISLGQIAVAAAQLAVASNQ
ncbi:MAG: carbamoyltransferase HypF [Caldilineales bacterium]|nr:carbamoyltransferase HypF [Caldilineales bacterium]